ncbi:hypothetical protein Tco_0308830 [Tanacetum coccineum]
MNETVTEEILGIDKDVTDVFGENGMEMDEDEEMNRRFESVTGDKVENQDKVVDDGIKDLVIVNNIKLVNVPLEAWSVKGISNLASRLGRMSDTPYLPYTAYRMSEQ